MSTTTRTRGRYRTIYMSMHADAKFRELSRSQPCGQSLWWHLLAGEHTGAIPGLSCIGEAALAEQLGWPLEPLPKPFGEPLPKPFGEPLPGCFREAFAEVEKLGMAKADWRARLLWVPNAIRYNRPPNPNVVLSWQNAWNELPECTLKAEAWQQLSNVLDEQGDAFGEAFRKACPNPLGNPSPNPLGNRYPNQEQEQEQEIEDSSDLSSTGSKPPTSTTKKRTKPEPEPEEPHPSGIVFPVVGDPACPTWALPARLVATLADAFPSLDIVAECRKAAAWCETNTAKRKTAGGMPKFLNSWMSKATDNPRYALSPNQGQAPSPKYRQAGQRPKDDA